MDHEMGFLVAGVLAIVAAVIKTLVVCPIFGVLC